MSAPRDLDRQIQSFLAEGPMELPDASYDEVRDRMEQKRQRAFIGPWRTPDVNRYLQIGLAAAAVVLIAVVGYQFLGRSNTGGPGASPSAEPSATATPEATLEPTAATPPPLTESFTSTLHGISVSYPEGWTTQAATEPWTERVKDPDGPRQVSSFPVSFLAPQVDWLYDPDLNSSLFLAIASQPISAVVTRSGDSTPEDWLAWHITNRVGCTPGESITVDGAAGLAAIDCTWVVVTTAGRGYWILLVAEGEAPPSYDDAWFEEVLATVQLRPEDAVD